MTQLDASDDEDVINPEPMALQTAFETPPRSRRAIVVQDFTPEGKIRPRESQALGTPCTGRPRDRICLCFKPLPYFEHDLSFKYSESLLWSLAPLSTPNEDVLSWHRVMSEVSGKSGRHWEAFTKHIQEPLCHCLKGTKARLYKAVQDVLTWGGQPSSRGIGLLHVVKVGKSQIMQEDLAREPQLLARLRSYASNARQQQAVLTAAPLIFVSLSNWHAELAEGFVHMHLHAYHSEWCLQVPSSKYQSYGSESYDVQGLSDVLNSVAFAASRTVSQLQSKCIEHAATRPDHREALQSHQGGIERELVPLSRRLNSDKTACCDVILTCPI